MDMIVVLILCVCTGVIDLQAKAEAKASVEVDGIEQDSAVKADYQAEGTEAAIEAWTGMAEAEHIEDGEMLQSQSYSFVEAECISTESECKVETSQMLYTYSEVPTLAGKTTGGDSSAASQGVAGQDVAMAGVSDGMIGVMAGRMSVWATVTVLSDGVWHHAPTYTCEFAGGQYMTAQWNGLCWVVHSYVVRDMADALDGNRRTYDIDFVDSENLMESVNFFYAYGSYEIMPMYARVNGVSGWRDKKLRAESHAPADPPKTSGVHVTVFGSASTQFVTAWEVPE